MLEKLQAQVKKLVLKNNLNPEQEEILFYGLQVLLTTLFELFLILAVAWALNCVIHTLIIAIVVGLIRAAAGGAHCRTFTGCCLVSCTAFPLLGKLASIIQWTNFDAACLIAASSVLMAAAIYILAPVDNPSKPIISTEYKRKLRLYSYILTLALVLLQILTFYNGSYRLTASLSSAMLWGSFSLTKPGHLLMDIIDRLIYKIPSARR